MKRLRGLPLRNYRAFMARKAREDQSGLGNAHGPRAGFRYPDKKLRAFILERDRFTCRYCGVQVTDKTANIDHVVAWPWGLTVPLNLVTACRPCNQAKGTAYVIPLGWKLRRRRKGGVCSLAPASASGRMGDT